MLFDLEDYGASGIVRGRYIPEKKLPNLLLGGIGYAHSDPWNTYIQTLLAQKTETVDYFDKAIKFLPLEKKENAVQKLITYFDKFRELTISGKAYWSMVESLPLKMITGGKVFQAGDKYIVSQGEVNNAQTQAKYIINYRGFTLTNADRNHPFWGYNDGALLYMSGEYSDYYAEYVEGNDPNYRIYTPYSEVIADNYYQKFEDLMTAIKDLMIAVEGYSTVFQPVQ